MYDIINKRAAHCIQKRWSNWKFVKRINALTYIHRHINSIQSNRLYIEQSIYSSLDEIAAKVHRQFRFIEQSLLFDFNPHNYGVHMQV